MYIHIQIRNKLLNYKKNIIMPIICALLLLLLNCCYKILFLLYMLMFSKKVLFMYKTGLYIIEIVSNGCNQEKDASHENGQRKCT